MIHLHFTGRVVSGFGRQTPTTCLVRTVDGNGWRQRDQVLYELHGRPSTKRMKGARAYMPRPFPPGTWDIIDVVPMGKDTLYYPVFIKTTARQKLDYWTLDGNEHYLEPSGEQFTGGGYADHYARVWSGGRLVPSNTTLGCLNTLDPDDARWLASKTLGAWHEGETVAFVVPPWDEWEE